MRSGVDGRSCHRDTEISCHRRWAAEQIGILYETGNYREMLHQMKVQRCTLMEQMHESQRKVDRMDFLIRNQEKQMK